MSRRKGVIGDALVGDAPTRSVPLPGVNGRALEADPEIRIAASVRALVELEQFLRRAGPD